VTGRDVLAFIDPEHRDTAVQSALTDPGKPLRTRGLRADGSSFPIEVSAYKVRRQGRVARLILVRDVSPLAVVVDDDNIVKNLLAALMRMAGYQTCAFQLPDAALQEFEPGMVSVVVTDVQMPGRNGVDLVAEMRKSDPELPVIFVSGFSESPVPRGDTKTRFVQKPFGVNDLKEALLKLPPRAQRELD
jgi:CheY-like chemotaxis protein